MTKRSYVATDQLQPIVKANAARKGMLKNPLFKNPCPVCNSAAGRPCFFSGAKFSGWITHPQRSNNNGNK